MADSGLSCAVRGLLSAAVTGFSCGCFSYCGAQAMGTQALVVATHRLRAAHTGSGTCTQAQETCTRAQGSAHGLREAHTGSGGTHGLRRHAHGLKRRAHGLRAVHTGSGVVHTGSGRRTQAREVCTRAQGGTPRLGGGAHGLSCSMACGIFLDHRLNPCPLHWQVDSYPLNQQGSLISAF